MQRDTLEKEFRTHFPDVPTGPLFLARAPGRVNLIGEHTDYNDGFVCPMAIDRETTLFGQPRSDATVRLYSLASREKVEFSIASEVPKNGPPWSLYPKGTAEALRRRLSLTRGFDAVVGSTVPMGGGLSSSAAFEVATAQAFLSVNQQTLPGEEIALACQWAEHQYPGVPCGIMDQFISTMGKKGHALLLDCRSQESRQVPLDDPTLRVVISNSNVRHELTGGEYKARRQQCEDAVEQLRKTLPTVHALRDVTPSQLQNAQNTLDPITYRRARHVITEIARTLDFAAALEQRNYPRCGDLMYGSHASLKNDYEVSCPELDALVDIARHVPGVFGARMTGGGFGGCIVALCTAPAVQPLTVAIATHYPKQFPGKQATTFSTTASAGASVSSE